MDEYKEYEKKHPEVAEIRRKLSEQIRKIVESAFADKASDREPIPLLQIPAFPTDLTNPFTLQRRAPVALEPGFHGRWENLSLSDLQLLKEIGVDID